MDSLNIEKLKKILALTTSTNDNEALAAIRLANKVLQAADKTWPEILDAGKNDSNQRFEELRLRYNILVERFNTLLAQRVSIQRFPQKKRIYRKRNFNRF